MTRVNAIVDNIIEETIDSEKEYNWKNAEFRVYYNTRTGKLWGDWEERSSLRFPLVDNDVVQICVSGHDEKYVRCCLKQAIVWAREGYRETLDGEPTQVVSITGFMKKF